MTRQGTVINHSILTSESVLEMPRDHKLVWIALLLIADDWGRLPDRPKILSMKSTALEITPDEFKEGIEAFINDDSIVRYTVQSPDGNRAVTVLQLSNWEEWQRRLKSRDYPKYPNTDGKIEKTTNPAALKSIENKEKEKEKGKEKINLNKGRPATKRSPPGKKPVKISHGEKVKLTEKEYEKLVTEFGEQAIKKKIDDMNEWCGMNDKTYKDYNLAIRKWLRKDGESKQTSFNKQLDEPDRHKTTGVIDL